MRRLILFAAIAASLFAQPVAVQQTEGEVRGFLVLRADDGTVVANGDSMQTTKSGQVTTRLTFHFQDGSLQEETTVFTQNGHFRVLSDRLVQKGPTFPRQLDMTVNGVSGQVTVTYAGQKGEPKTETTHLDIPPDLANGIVPVLLKNLPSGDTALTVPMVVASPKPMLVKLQIHADGTDKFTTGTTSREATRYDVHVDIGGVKGAIADVLGKNPPDTYVWILGGECPAFLKSNGPSFAGGPIWRTELVSPVWPASAGAATRSKRDPMP